MGPTRTSLTGTARRRSTLCSTTRRCQSATPSPRTTVTDWNIDEQGNKVWGGKEKCEPVSWEECKIVKKAVDFPAVKTNCDIVATIKWADFVQGSTEIVEMKQSCEVK